MRLIQNSKAISRLSLILIMLASAITGALLSYMWVVGYYENLKIRVPETPTIAITDVSFNDNDTSFFEVTVLNPTYSASDEPANVMGFAVSTKNGLLYNVTEVDPGIPLPLNIGESETFTCYWNWANYTGETVKIIALTAEESSGATLQKETPLVRLLITEVDFDPTVSVTRFNMTVKNSNSSVTHINVTQIVLTSENVTVHVGNLTTPSLPYRLDPNDSVLFRCDWNWTDYQNKNITIVAHTSQGYRSQSYKVATPKPTVFGITDVLFSIANTTYFNVTVQNFEVSPLSSYVNITKISVVMENGTTRDITEVYPPLTPPPALYQNDSVTFRCSWNWTEYLGKNVTVIVNTVQNYTASYNETTAVPITITEAAFNLNYTSYFNITVQNSEFSPTSANITKIILTMENATVQEINGTLVDPPLIPNPYSLDAGENETFACQWNWKYYQGKNVVIAVHTLENYTAYYRQMTPVNLTLNVTHVVFNPRDTSYFDVTIENSEHSFVDANITKIIVTVENETLKEITELIPHLPKILPVNSSVAFRCSWNWTEYRGKDVIITIETSQGYTISRTGKIPGTSST